MADSGEKTEQPSQRRLQKAKEKGQFPVSREFVSAVQFLFVVYALTAFGPEWMARLETFMRRCFQIAFRAQIGPMDLILLFRDGARDTFVPLLKTGALLVLLVFAIHLLTTRGGIALSKLTPDFSRLNPMQKVQQMRRQNVQALVQALVLLPVFSCILFLVLRANAERLLSIPLTHVRQGISELGSVLARLLWQAAFCFLLVGAVDFVRQQRRHAQDLKMTKQEVREESKESEGNPQIKQRIRRLQRDAARRNMMREVPKATAVIVNPTHYSVAIRYLPETMAAPTVVAKGKNYLALRIRQKAMEHDVPIVENVALAQALYKSADVGQEIPSHLYRAVAEVLAYIYRLMKGNLPGRL